MARYENVDDYFRDKINALDRAKREIETNIAHNSARAIQEATKTDNDVRVTQRRNQLRVEVEEEEDRPGVIDLKKHFKQSPNRKTTKDGGWYMIIPIRRYTSRNSPRREQSTGMSSRLYKDLLDTQPKEGYANIMSDYLYDNRRGGSPISQLNYTPKSNRITRMRNPAAVGRGHIYISFRTVSDKSHPSSWILNRNKVRPNDRSQEIRRIIDEVKSYNFRRNLR